MNFLHARMSTIGKYHEELVPESFYLQWHARTKMKNTHRILLKEGNGDQNYLRCLYLQDNNFDILFSDMALYKVDLACAKTVKLKPTRNDSGFITNSNTIYFLVYSYTNMVIL